MREERAMALIGNDFNTIVLTHPSHCGECGKYLPKGTEMLVSIRFGKVQKRVCSEQCRIDFDDSFWQGKADERVSQKA